MSVGGVLGGMFNALLAPIIFTSIAEYPIAAVLACFVCPVRSSVDKPQSRQFDSAGVITVLGLVLGTLLLQFGTEAAGMPGGPIRKALTITLPVILCYALSRKPAMLAVALIGLFTFGWHGSVSRGQTLEVHRGFFGVHRVSRTLWSDNGKSGSRQLNLLFHGTTMHGQQPVDISTGLPIEPRSPMGYYHHDGPIGLAFARLGTLQFADNVGLVGLGAGELASYAEPGQRFTYFEIDPIVKQIAGDQSRFNILSYAPQTGAGVGVVLGASPQKHDSNAGEPVEGFIIDA
jgi:hypothetical protein